MQTIQQLLQEKAHLTEAIASIKKELHQMDGEQYQGCWLDSTSDRTGQKSYTRLRWFIDVTTKKKGCRTLKGKEIKKASRAIALWNDLAQYEADLAYVCEEIQVIYEAAQQWGLQLPDDALPPD